MMRRVFQNVAWGLLAVGIAACTNELAPEDRQLFEFRAIDDEGTPITALVVVDDDWSAAGRNRIVASATGVRLTLDFAQQDEHLVALVPFDQSQPLPASRADAMRFANFVDEPARRLRRRDPSKQLFVFVRR